MSNAKERKQGAKEPGDRIGMLPDLDQGRDGGDGGRGAEASALLRSLDLRAGQQRPHRVGAGARVADGGGAGAGDGVAAGESAVE